MEEGRIAVGPNGQRLIVQGGKLVPYNAPTPAPATGSAAGGAGVTPGKTPEVREPTPQNPSFLEDVGRSGPAELTRGIAGLLSFPRTVTDLAGGTPAGMQAYPSYNDIIGAAEAHAPFPMDKPQTTGGKYVGTALQMLPGAAAGTGGIIPRLLQWGGASLGSEAASQWANSGDQEASPGTDAVMRTLGAVAGASPMALARKAVTPHPYNQKGLAALEKAEADAAANTNFSLAQKYTKQGPHSVVDPTHPHNVALKEFNDEMRRAGAGRNAIDPSKYFKDAYNQLPAGTRPPSNSVSGEQFRLMQDALRGDMRNASAPQRGRMQNFSNALDTMMDYSQTGKPTEGAWAGVRAQRGALEEGVEKAASRGGILPGVGALAGTLAAQYGGMKYGIPPGASHVLGALAGAGLGKMIPGKDALNNAFPMYRDYLRNQAWQPSQYTNVNKSQLARELASGDLILPPLVTEPPR